MKEVMKKALALTLILALASLVVLPVLAAPSREGSIKPAAAHEYWGSKNSNKFHYPYCTWAKKIKPSNLVIFKSRQEALNSGYVPCKVCKP